MKKGKFTTKTPSWLGDTLKGALIIAALFIAISFAIALICYNTEDPTSNVGLLSMIAFLLAGAGGAFLNAKLFGKEKLSSPLFSSLLALVIFFVIALISAGRLSLGNLMNGLCFALVSLFALFLGKKRKPATHKRARAR